METRTMNVVLPKEMAACFKGYVYFLTGSKPFSTEYWDEIYIQADLTQKQVELCDAFLAGMNENGVDEYHAKWAYYEPRKAVEA